MSTPKNDCERIKEFLVDQGAEGIAEDAALSAHHAGCEQCQALLRAWEQIPDLLAQLPEHAPDELLLRKARPVLPARLRRRRMLAPSLASAAVLLACIGLSRELLREDSLRYAPAGQVVDALAPAKNNADLGQIAGRVAPVVLGDEGGASASRRDASEQAADYDPYSAPPAPAAPPEPIKEATNDASNYGGLNRHRGSSANATVAETEADDQDLEELTTVTVTGSRIQSQTITAASPVTVVDREEFRLTGKMAEGRSVAAPPSEGVLVSDGPSESARAPKPSTRPAAPSEPPARRALDRLAEQKREETADAALEHSNDGEDGNRQLADSRLRASVASKDDAKARAGGGFASSAPVDADAAGFDLLQHYQQTEGVAVQPANGYWANSYVPGDPEIRWLSARLVQWDRSWLPSAAPLERSVRPISQPFDAPADNALALSVMADANAVDSAADATRLRLQVGIRGIDRRGGQRPPMSLGVVVDLPADAPDSVRIASRALLDALLQSKQAGDRFSLIVTGEPGKRPGAIVEAEDFRFGPLQLAQQAMLSDDANGAPADRAQASPPLALYAAIERAGVMVRNDDDPSRPLGSSAVLLISAGQITDPESLQALVHQRAKDGITLSVFPLGDADSQEAEELALAGLGNRRFLEAPNQARALVEDELYAASRAVARAVRLSIRLAPGVQLVQVIGAERLDQPQAQRVREIERSMDQRLSANLGIQADRGDDEEGIQIVIPSIYSGDSVSVLIDVIVDRPGAIADVSLRYKDLVFLQNGSLHSHLSLPEGELKRGPRELSVLKDLLAHHFVIAVEQAAVALGQSQVDKAAAALREMRATIEQARASVPAWANDADLNDDQQLLDRYLAALSAAQEGAQESQLADSMRYAAWAKTHRALKEWK